MILESIFPKIQTWDDIKSLLINNKDSLKYLDNYGGIDSFLGSGENGKVWKIKGKPLTIKLTKDRNEIKIANKLLGKKLKAFVNVYMISNVKYQGKDIQLRIQDMCYPYDKSEWDMYGRVLLGLYDFFNEVKRGTLNDFVLYLKSVAEDNINDYIEIGRTGWVDEERKKLEKDLKSIQSSGFKKWFDFYTNIYNDSKKIGISFDNIDLHDDNIMQDSNKNLRLIDF